MRYLIFLFAVTFFLTSCNEESSEIFTIETTETIANESQQNFSTTIPTSSCSYNCEFDTNISNSINNYDEVGKKHNETLCLFYGEKGPSNNNPSMQEFEDLLSTEFPDSPIEDPMAIAEEVAEMLENDSADKFLDKYADPVNKNLIYDLLDLIDDYNGYNLCDIIDQIKTLESSAISLNNQEAITQFLIASSIARYSLSYWDPFMTEADKAEVKLFGRKFWKKLLVAAADVLGGVGGAAAGSTYGPAGSVIGAAAGGTAASGYANELLTGTE